MNRLEFLKQQVRDGREFLEGTIADVTPEQAHWAPPGRAVPVAAHYAHVVMSQDVGLHALVLDKPPLAAGEWAGRTGVPSLPPAFGHPWEEWAHGTFDLNALREYAQAVYSATDACFDGLAEDDLDRSVDLSAAGFGVQSLGYVLVNGWVTNVSLHCGEISTLKGLQGAKGYPV